MKMNDTMNTMELKLVDTIPAHTIEPGDMISWEGSIVDIVEVYSDNNGDCTFTVLDIWGENSEIFCEYGTMLNLYMYIEEEEEE